MVPSVHMNRHLVRLLPPLLVAVSIVRAGADPSKKPTEAYPSDVASAWFDTLYDVVKTEGTAPPQASRIYGISAVALYESIVGGSETHLTLVGQLNELGTLPGLRPEKKCHWPTVANSALATVIRGLYPGASQSSRDRIDVLERQFATQFQGSLPGPVYSRSVALGQDVANAVLGWAATDG